MKLSPTTTLLLVFFTNIVGLFASIFGAYTNTMKNEQVLVMNGVYGLILGISLAVVTVYLTDNMTYGLVLGGAGIILFLLYFDAVTNKFGIWKSIMSKLG